MKQIFKSEIAIRVVSRLAAAYLWFVDKTIRWESVGEENILAFQVTKSPFVLAFWHGRLLLMGPHFDQCGVPTEVLVSQHGDGEIITRAVSHFDIGGIRGSTSKGGAKALTHVVRHLKLGRIVAFTPDGPRGPRMRIFPGVISAAKMAGLPIIPIANGCSNRKHLRSWDKMMVPLPFGKALYLIGKPFYVPKNAKPEELEKIRLELEEYMIEQTRMCDHYCGHPAIEAAPVTIVATPDESA